MTSKIECRVSTSQPLQQRPGKHRTLSLQPLVKALRPFLSPLSFKAIEPPVQRDHRPNYPLPPIPPATKNEQHRQTSPRPPLSRSRRSQIAASPPRVDMRPVSTFEVFEFDDQELWSTKELKEPRRRVREVVGRTGDWVLGAKVLGGKGRVAVVCLEDELEDQPRRSTSSTTPTLTFPSSDLTPQPSLKRPPLSAPIHSIFKSASSSFTGFSLDGPPSRRSLTSPSSVLLDYHLAIDLEAESPLSSLVLLSSSEDLRLLDSDKGPITPPIFIATSNSTSFSRGSNASTSSAFSFETEDEDGPTTPEWMKSFGGREMGERKEWEK